MKRLHCINLIGMLVLGVLCSAQWQRDRTLNLEVRRLEKLREANDLKIREQGRELAGVHADLDQLKAQFAKSGANNLETRRELLAAEVKARQLTLERDQLKTSVTNWAGAVAARDERLKEADAQIKKLGAEAKLSVEKFNKLATNYNTVVKELNEFGSQSPLPSPLAK